MCVCVCVHACVCDYNTFVCVKLEQLGLYSLVSAFDITVKIPLVFPYIISSLILC